MEVLKPSQTQVTPVFPLIFVLFLQIHNYNFPSKTKNTKNSSAVYQMYHSKALFRSSLVSFRLSLWSTSAPHLFLSSTLSSLSLSHIHRGAEILVPAFCLCSSAGPSHVGGSIVCFAVTEPKAKHRSVCVCVRGKENGSAEPSNAR